MRNTKTKEIEDYKGAYESLLFMVEGAVDNFTTMSKDNDGGIETIKIMNQTMKRCADALDRRIQDTKKYLINYKQLTKTK